MTQDTYADEILQSLREHNLATDEELALVREYLTT